MSHLNPPDHNAVDRLLAKDATLWNHPSIDIEQVRDRLGWLDSVAWMESHTADITHWANQVVQTGRFEQVVLLGMGGSSLAAEVFNRVFGSKAGYPQFMMLDTTSPAHLLSLSIRLEKTLFIVSSKSGTTIETADLCSYFYHRLSALVKHAGEHFVAITDADSLLQKQASEQGFMKIFINPPNIGGRYSALSFFGLVPAALMGIELTKLLDQARLFIDSCGTGSDRELVLQLAQLMADNATRGRNKLHLQLQAPLQSLAIWIEQLVAESTGKQGKGIIPIYDQPDSGVTNDDQIVVRIKSWQPGSIDLHDEKANAADMEWSLSGADQLAAEFLRWEMATALTCSTLEINPFDQPNVEESKISTREMIASGSRYVLNAVIDEQEFNLYGNGLNPQDRGFTDPIEAFARQSQRVSYIAILAYLAESEQTDLLLAQLRGHIGRRFKKSTTIGYGPRYLHSTGQLHKGGPPLGCFIQIVEETLSPLPIANREYGFDVLHRAQADGDYSVLDQKRLPIMRIGLKGDRLGALDSALSLFL